MSILVNNQTPAQLAAAQLTNIIKQAFFMLGQSGNSGYNLIWKNPKATPQEVIAALGTNALLIFQLANLNIQTVTQAATLAGTTPPVIPSVPDGWTLTPNSDGSMTVTQSSSSAATATRKQG
jgi:hypothetical protein